MAEYLESFTGAVTDAAVGARAGVGVGADASAASALPSKDVVAAKVFSCTGSGEAPGSPRGFGAMPVVDWIISQPSFIECLGRLAELEAAREFCHHDVSHLMDVARIMWAVSLERDLGFDKQLVYATALLHDLGKACQYETGEPHEVAGVRIASEVLAAMPVELAFSAEDRQRILAAIAGHRHLRPDAEPLERLLYEADKASRACWACAAQEACNWPREKKNLLCCI